MALEAWVPFDDLSVYRAEWSIYFKINQERERMAKRAAYPGIPKYVTIEKRNQLSLTLIFTKISMDSGFLFKPKTSIIRAKDRQTEKKDNSLQNGIISISL